MLQEGIQQSVQQGELNVLRRQIEKRFGTIPAWAEERSARQTAIELEDLGVQMLDAVSREDLLN